MLKRHEVAAGAWFALKLPLTVDGASWPVAGVPVRLEVVDEPGAAVVRLGLQLGNGISVYDAYTWVAEGAPALTAGLSGKYHYRILAELEAGKEQLTESGEFEILRP